MPMFWTEMYEGGNGNRRRARDRSFDVMKFELNNMNGIKKLSPCMGRRQYVYVFLVGGFTCAKKSCECGVDYDAMQQNKRIFYLREKRWENGKKSAAKCRLSN